MGRIGRLGMALIALLMMIGGAWAQETATIDSSITEEVIAQDVSLAKQEDVPVGTVLYRRQNVETVKADEEGKLLSRVYTEPQWDMTGKPLVQYDAATGKIGAKSRYVKFIPDEATAKLEKTQDVSNTGVKEFYMVPDNTTSKLSWTIDTDATAVEWNSTKKTLTFKAFGGLYMFETPPPVAWDANKDQVKIVSDYKSGVLTYTIPAGEYSYPLTVDPTVTINAIPSAFGWIYGRSSTYSSARSSAYYSGSSISDDNIVGNYYVSPYYYVDRIFLSFNLAGQSAGTVSSCKLYYYSQYSNSGSRLKICQGTQAGSVGTGWFNLFTGYTNGAAHSPTYYSDESLAGSYTLSWLSGTFNSTGNTAIQSALGVGVVKMVLLSTTDIANTTPSGDSSDHMITVKTNYPYLEIVYTASSGGSSIPPRTLYNRDPVPIWINRPISIWKR